MSRVIDMTKPISKWNEDDLRYAHDRSLLDPEDMEKVGNWLRQKQADREGVDVSELEDGDTETVVYDPAEHNAHDVAEYLKSLDRDTGEGDEEFRRVIQAEADRGDDARTTILKLGE